MTGARLRVECPLHSLPAGPPCPHCEAGPAQVRPQVGQLRRIQGGAQPCPRPLCLDCPPLWGPVHVPTAWTSQAASSCCPLGGGVLPSVCRGTCIVPPPSAWWTASSPDTTPRCSPTAPQVPGVSGGGAGGAGSLAAQAPARCGAPLASGPRLLAQQPRQAGEVPLTDGHGASERDSGFPSTQPSPRGSAPRSVRSGLAPPVQMGKLRP